MLENLIFQLFINRPITCWVFYYSYRSPSFIGCSDDVEEYWGDDEEYDEYEDEDGLS